MKHKNCKGSINLDLTSAYLIVSPSMTISTKGVGHGVVEIISSKDRKATSKFVCDECGESFSGKDEIENEIVACCSICQQEKSPSEIRVTDYIPFICETCLKQEPGKKKLDSSSLERRMYLAYQEILTKTENPTLLSILMKR